MFRQTNKTEYAINIQNVFIFGKTKTADTKCKTSIIYRTIYSLFFLSLDSRYSYDSYPNSAKIDLPFNICIFLKVKYAPQSVVLLYFFFVGVFKYAHCEIKSNRTKKQIYQGF